MPSPDPRHIVRGWLYPGLQHCPAQGQLRNLYKRNLGCLHIMSVPVKLKCRAPVLQINLSFCNFKFQEGNKMSVAPLLPGHENAHAFVVPRTLNSRIGNFNLICYAKAILFEVGKPLAQKLCRRCGRTLCLGFRGLSF